MVGGGACSVVPRLGSVPNLQQNESSGRATGWRKPGKFNRPIIVDDASGTRQFAAK